MREGDKVNLEKWPTKVDPVYKSKEQYKSLLEEHVAKLSALQRSPLRLQSSRDIADPSGDRRRGKGRRDPACDVRRQSSGLSGLQLQAAHGSGAGARLSLADDARSAGARTDRDLQSFLLRGGAGRPGASRHSREAKPFRTRRITTRRSGASATAPSTISRGISTSTEPASSKSSSTSRRKNSESAFSSASTTPSKNWKFSDADLKERKFWDDYAKAYEECLSATSTDAAPWYVVPADDKENARLIVSQILLDTFEGLDMRYPKTGAKREIELQAFRKALTK